MLLFQMGWALSISAVILQLAVFLQPFLPQQMQVAVLCETITSVLQQPDLVTTHDLRHSDMMSAAHHYTPISDHRTFIKQVHSNHDSGMHDAYHHCPFCMIYNHLISFLDLGIDEVLVKLNIRLLAFIHVFKHVYFNLQRLFLIPQGRAPPRFS